MGMNYNSIHVIGSTIDEVSFRLSNCQLFNKYQLQTQEMAKNIRSNNITKIASIFSKIKPNIATFYLIDDEHNNVSVVSDYFDFITMKDEVKKWFFGLDCYVLLVNCFDSDVIEIALYNKHKYLTSYVTGRNLNDYCLTESRFDSSVIHKAFNLSPHHINMAYDKDPEIAIQNFTTLFKLPLDLKVYDLINDTKRLVEEASFYL